MRNFTFLGTYLRDFSFFVLFGTFGHREPICTPPPLPSPTRSLVKAPPVRSSGTPPTCGCYLQSGRSGRDPETVERGRHGHLPLQEGGRHDDLPLQEERGQDPVSSPQEEGREARKEGDKIFFI